MSDQVSDSDSQPPLAELHSQLDHLSRSLHEWQQPQAHLQPIEQRLSKLLDLGSELLERLVATDERHAQIVGDVESRLNEWSAIESRFRDRAKSLDAIYAAAASSAGSLARAESRLIGANPDGAAGSEPRSTDVQPASAPLSRGAEPPAATGDRPEAWPLEGIVRLHDELRQTAQGPVTPRLTSGDLPAKLAGRVESLELAVTVGKEEFSRVEDRIARQRRRSSLTTAALGSVVLIAVIAAGALAFGLNQRVEARLSEAAARVAAAQKQAEAATELANARIDATRQDAERQIAEARQTARQAQIVSDVLAAADLVRINLPGAARAPRSSAQLLWSQSRGLVFSGSRVPAAPPGTTNQLWLLTEGQPVSAGIFVPDSKGRVMWASDDLPVLRQPVTGAALTLEPAGGASQRSGEDVLSRAVVASTPEPEHVTPN